jgi:hypothetical protein
MSKKQPDAPQVEKPQTEEVATEVRHIGDLKFDKNNPRKHTPRNIGVIVDSLNEVGGLRSIVVDEELNIIAGNGTIEAAAEAGIHRVRVIETDGTEIIAVKRTNLDPRQKLKAKYSDNRSAELAIWDAEQVAADAEVDSSIFEGMFYDKELDRILATAADALPEFEAGDGAPEGDNGRLRDGQAVSTAGLPISAVQLVQLLYTPDQKSAFDAGVKFLGEVFRTDNPTDTVLALVMDAMKLVNGARAESELAAISDRRSQQVST